MNEVTESMNCHSIGGTQRERTREVKRKRESGVVTLWEARVNQRERQ